MTSPGETARRTERTGQPCPEPVGIHEIAERHGTTPGTIRSWRNRYLTKEPRFPEPVVVLAMGPLFDWKEIEEWLKTRR